MTKKDRDPRTWSNAEIQADSDGYVRAQQAYADDQEAATRKQQEADDERRWTEEFVSNGGRAADAPAAFRKHRTKQAEEAAGRAENEALSASRDHVRHAL